MGTNQAILRILHLSDLHFTCSKKQGDKWAVQAFNEQMVNRSMLKAIEQLTREGIRFDLIITTGDIAFSGKSEEYEVAGLFFKELLEKTGLEKNRLFAVPGNHDVDRNQIDELIGKSIYTYSTQDEISGIIMHKTLFPHLMNKFFNFFQFAGSIMGYQYYSGDSFCYADHTTIVKNNHRFLINLAGLNSALFSKDDKDRERKLALGIYQVDKIINSLAKTAILTIAFFHHPFACFHDMEKGTKNRLIEAMDIILTGHLHEPDPSFIQTAAGKAVMIGAGASFKTRESCNSFDIIEIDLLTGKGHVRFYKYLPAFNGWKKNTDVNPHADDGSFPLEIQLKKEHEPGPGNGGGLTGNPSRYLRYLHDECAYINIRGIVITFQEYLAALSLGGKMESEQKQLLIKPEILHDPSWREVLLLFGGVLYNQGKDKIDGFLASILKTAEVKEKTLADEAQCVGLLGAIIRDIPSDTYEFKNDLYTAMLTRVMGIFDKKTAPCIPLETRAAAADALALAGDMRFAKPEKNWITIPGCTFLMGAQKDDPGKPNYDPDAYENEKPVHKVTLSEFKIAKYPVTAGEYKRFMEDGGYDKEEYWIPDGWEYIKGQNIKAPRDWDDQVLYGTRPVVGINWFEARAYAKWAGTVWKGADLPTEAEWERAARGGIAYKKYPWGEGEPDGKNTHSGHNKLGHAAPVGIFPTDCTTEGVIDIGGNVLEWCKDKFDDTAFYKKSTGSIDPVNDESGNLGVVGEKESRTVRGGCWGSLGRDGFRCAGRGRGDPLGRYNILGFRLVLRGQVRR